MIRTFSKDRVGRVAPPIVLAAALALMAQGCGDRGSMDPEAEQALDEALRAQEEHARAWADRVDEELGDRDYDPDRVAEELAERQAELEAEREAAAEEAAEQAGPDDE